MRGPVRYNEEDVLQMEDDEAEGGETKGVELCTFSEGMDDYLVYAAVDPLVMLAQSVPAPGAGAQPALAWRALPDDFQGGDAFAARLEEELQSLSAELADQAAEL